MDFRKLTVGIFVELETAEECKFFDRKIYTYELGFIISEPSMAGITWWGIPTILTR